MTTPHDETFDAGLHLLDRQIVDESGELAGKVDDLELTERPDGALAVSGLLVGVSALLPRFGGARTGRWLLERWRTVAVTRADRMVPGWISVFEIAELTSEVTLRVPREGVVSAQPREGGAPRYRLDQLLDMRVSVPGRDERMHVLDARLAPRSDLGRGEVRVVGIVLGSGGRPGARLGYQRNAGQGPWLVAKAVRWLHRHAELLEMKSIESIDWHRGVITATGPPVTLRGG